ncbi:MAG: hypothetical protein E7256_02220 [Lachnospiraceae bacterium]|nr:hypothetical protein [Lachnospiraceae bacterium]
MKEQLMVLAASFIAGAIIMILHELPKAMIYQYNEKKHNLPYKNVFSLYHYIDPIGLIFCVVTKAGFSKPYLYRIKEKKMNMILGIAGYLSLLVQFLASTAVLRFCFHMDYTFVIVGSHSFLYEFMVYFTCAYALISMGMLITNLFPYMASDMGLVIAATSPLKFFTVIRADYLIKMVWLFTVLLGIIRSISGAVLGLFL